MAWLAALMQFFKIFGFFMDLNKESRENEAKRKAKLGKEMVDAIAEPDKKLRASRISIVINKL